MKKKILCTMISMVMVASLFAGCGTDSGKENSASDTSKTKEAGTTISVAAIETAYGSEMWQKVADAFTEETGIKVELTTDKKLEDVIGPSMQGGEYSILLSYRDLYVSRETYIVFSYCTLL